MEDDWTRLIKGREENIYPKKDQEVWVKVYDHKTDKYYETKSIFHEDDDFRWWIIHIPDGTRIRCLPEWWKNV
jgi:hypothetical protein